MNDREISEVIKFIDKNKKIIRIPHVNLFLVSDRIILRIFRGSYGYSLSADNLGMIRSLKPERGNLLDMFVKIEFLVNQIFCAHFFGFFSKRSGAFIDLLNRVNLSQKIRVLYGWGLIKKRKTFENVIEVRNDCAHGWDIGEFKYKGNPIIRYIFIVKEGTRPNVNMDNFSQFKKDLEIVWLELTNAYSKIERDNELDAKKIIKKMELAIKSFKKRK